MAASTPIPKRINFQVTIAAGTPVRLAPVGAPRPVLVSELSIQSRAGNTGLGYVLGGVPIDVVADAANAKHLSQELAAAASNVLPGGLFTEPFAPAGGFNTGVEVDLREYAVDGSHTGDLYIVSYYLRD